MLREQLRELLAPVVAGLGYQLWELEYLPQSGGGMLRIYIDSASDSFNFFVSHFPGLLPLYLQLTDLDPSFACALLFRCHMDSPLTN